MRPLKFSDLVIQSIRQRPFRNIATILCFIVITGTLLSTYFLVGGAKNSVEVGMDRLGADVLVLPQDSAMSGEAVLLTGKPSTFIFANSVQDQIAGMEGVEKAAPQIYIGTLQNAACCTGRVQLIGFDPVLDFTIQPWLISELGRPLRRGEVVVGSGFTSEAGSVLTFYGKNFTVAGKLDPSGMGMDESAFIMLDDAYSMAGASSTDALVPVDIRPGEISAVLIRVSPGADKEKLAATIKETIPGTHPVTLNYIASKVNSQLSATTQVLVSITAAVTLVSFPFMALISTMVANERRRELALLRAMGATKGFVFRTVLAEALAIAAAGGLLGVAISGFLLYLFEPLIIGSLQMPFLWPPIGSLLVEVTIIILIAVAVGGAAALIPAIRSSNLEPYDAIRRGER